MAGESFPRPPGIDAETWASMDDLAKARAIIVEQQEKLKNAEERAKTAEEENADYNDLRNRLGPNWRDRPLSSLFATFRLIRSLSGLSPEDAYPASSGDAMSHSKNSLLPEFFKSPEHGLDGRKAPSFLCFDEGLLNRLAAISLEGPYLAEIVGPSWNEPIAAILKKQGARDQMRNLLASLDKLRPESHAKKADGTRVSNETSTTRAFGIMLELLQDIFNLVNVLSPTEDTIVVGGSTRTQPGGIIPDRIINVTINFADGAPSDYACMVGEDKPNRARDTLLSFHAELVKDRRAMPFSRLSLKKNDKGEWRGAQVLIAKNLLVLFNMEKHRHTNLSAYATPTGYFIALHAPLNKPENALSQSDEWLNDVSLSVEERDHCIMVTDFIPYEHELALLALLSPAVKVAAQLIGQRDVTSSVSSDLFSRLFQEAGSPTVLSIVDIEGYFLPGDGATINRIRSSASDNATLGSLTSEDEEERDDSEPDPFAGRGGSSAPSGTSATSSTGGGDASGSSGGMHPGSTGGLYRTHSTAGAVIEDGEAELRMIDEVEPQEVSLKTASIINLSYAGFDNALALHRKEPFPHIPKLHPYLTPPTTPPKSASLSPLPMPMSIVVADPFPILAFGGSSVVLAGAASDGTAVALKMYDVAGGAALAEAEAAAYVKIAAKCRDVVPEYYGRFESDGTDFVSIERFGAALQSFKGLSKLEKQQIYTHVCNIHSCAQLELLDFAPRNVLIEPTARSFRLIDFETVDDHHCASPASCAYLKGIASALGIAGMVQV